MSDWTVAQRGRGPSQWSEWSLEVLRADGEFTLSRARHADGREPLLLLTVNEHPAPAQSVRRLEREGSLASRLDPAWAVMPLEVVRYQGSPALLLEDMGGTPLDRLLRAPLAVGRFLPLALELAVALGHIHGAGLIHKDVKPSNVLVGAGDRVRFTGFGNASLLPRERSALQPTEALAGTLAYIAPEQTGRMNRSVDARSDLYSLGVVFYQMLTGALPFEADNPLEWVHCHIAREPRRPVDIPPMLSDLVLKLLAKTAEGRYQSARGLELDLRRCLAQWQSEGRVEAFVPGSHDTSDCLLIPEKLYGREPEVEALKAAFDRVVDQGRVEVVIISGPSGVGKSSLVNELPKALAWPQALYASGKFDQHKRHVPYATLAQAFQSLIRQILGLSESEVGRWRDALIEAVGLHGALIANLIPEFELIVGPQPPVAELPPQHERNRFTQVLRRFVCVFTSFEHPLALFLDDLQWVDLATLDFFEHLVTHEETNHLLLVGAYRDNEVDPDHPLLRTISALQRHGAGARELTLSPLSLDDVCLLVGDSMGMTATQVLPLGQLVLDKTAGNPFFAVQFLAALAEDGLIEYRSDIAAWGWELERIRSRPFSDSVVDLMVMKLSRLPEVTRIALSRLACLGDMAETRLLQLVHRTSEDGLHRALWDAVRAGLVFRTDQTYSFLHDRVQEAAYALIPSADVASVHLEIGRQLADLPTAQVFDVVNQLNRALELLHGAERIRLSELNLQAGRRAQASTGYSSALAYLSVGQELLGEDRWQEHYSLAFGLAFHRAECEFLLGHQTIAEERLATLSRHSANQVDLAQVTCLQVALYTTLDRSDRALDACLAFLRGFGIEWSCHPSDREVDSEFEQLWRRLEGRSIESLLDLPVVSDPNLDAAMQVLFEAYPAALFTDNNLMGLILGRMANLSLEHGNGHGSCLGYAYMGLVLGPRYARYDAAFRFGKLALELVARGLNRFEARVYLGFGNYQSPWRQHVRAGRVYMQKALDLTYASGDVTYTAYIQFLLVSQLLASGDPLEEVQDEAERALHYAKGCRFGLAIAIVTAQLGLIRTLQGRTARLGSFSTHDADEESFQEGLTASRNMALPSTFYWIHKLQACYFAGHHAESVRAAERAQPLVQTSPAFLRLFDYHFFAALARAAYCHAAPVHEHPQLQGAILDHHGHLEAWAQNCPDNFQHRADLVAAELAHLEQRPLQAEQLYERAIHGAQEYGFLQDEALSHECAARFYARRGLTAIARMYFGQARVCFQRWGAHAKVEQLDREQPGLVPRDAPGSWVGQLDLQAVVKLSQAVSGELVLDRLFERLLAIAVEHAGAVRGLLLRADGPRPRLEAEATIHAGAISVSIPQGPVQALDLPETILRFVVRTRESVILDDASMPNSFSADVYIRQNKARSIVCLPLVKQTALVGVLYLENNLVSHVFNQNRIAVLDLLASQAAISLENARLYADLQQAEAYLGEAQRLSRTGSFGWRPGSGEISWSLETFRIFEVDPRTTPTLDLILRVTHPADREFVQAGVEHGALRGHFEHEHRLLMKDGRVKYIHVVAVARSAVGESMFVGAVMDITARRAGEEALRASEQLTRGQIAAMVSTLDALAQESSLERVLEHVVRAIANPLKAHGIIVWLGDEDHGLQSLQAALEEGRFHTGSEVAPVLPLSQQTRVWEEICRTRKPVVLDDAPATFLAVPMLISGQLAGVVGVHFSEKRVLRSEEIALAQALAVQASMAIQLTRLSAESRQAAVTAERNRMARDMHDTLAQGFTGVILQLEAAEDAISRGLTREVDHHLVRAGEMARLGLREARRSVRALRPQVLQQGDLAFAMRELMESMTQGTTVKAHFRLSGGARPLPPLWEENLLRISQEVLTNSLKHAHCREFSAELEFSHDQVRFAGRDNGCGFEPTDSGEGFGLVGMRERVEELGGQLVVASERGRGTSVEVSLPLAALEPSS